MSANYRRIAIFFFFSLTVASQIAIVLLKRAGVDSSSESPDRIEVAKQKLLNDGGGNKETEAAVAAGLAWLAKQQNLTDDYWEYDGTSKAKRVAATGMCLLPFLAAGETHKSGKEYKETVNRGLNYLKMQIKPSGELDQSMYAHAIGTMALCEAAGMTFDEVLKKLARSAVDYIVKAQAQNGSWGYSAGTDGDTSITGWQIQALHSARLAGIAVSQSTFDQAALFLDSVSDDSRATYGYRTTGSTDNLTAVGLLCRQYMGWTSDDPPLVLGVAWMWIKHPPNQNDFNMYYYYYATQVIHNLGGPDWHRDWNPKMQKILLDLQITETTEGAAADDYGSWPKDNDNGHIGSSCGKLGTTALAVLTLEVYYRNMPLYYSDDFRLKAYRKDKEKK